MVTFSASRRQQQTRNTGEGSNPKMGPLLAITALDSRPSFQLGAIGLSLVLERGHFAPSRGERREQSTSF